MSTYDIFDALAFIGGGTVLYWLVKAFRFMKRLLDKLIDKWYGD